MKKIIIGMVIGLVAGAAGTYALMQSGGVSPHRPLFTQPKPIQDIPKMSVAAAEDHRKGAYTEIQTIEDTLALPTDFAQTEALYTLAGRSDARAVQDLIYQANQIADLSERRAGLQILFSRFAELDPPSALALAQTSEYAANKRLEAMIWSEWGKNDIHSALIAAADLESNVRRNLAAQALYSAYGYAGNDTIAMIEDALRVPVNRNTKAQHLYSIAVGSPLEAIAYVESQYSPQDQQILSHWLARYLAQSDPQGARRYAEMFQSKRLRDTYLQAFVSASAESDPEAALEDALAQGGDQRQRNHAATALSQLASRDPEKAIAYMARARNPRERQMFASVIANGLAQLDPDRALQWALESDHGVGQQVFVSVLSVIADQDPQRALDAAVAIQNTAKRKIALSSILSTVARSDPMLAVRYLDLIDNKEIERSAASKIARSWARLDPDAAIDWILTREGVDQRSLLSQLGSTLVHIDAQAAMRLLPRLDDQSAAHLRVQIVTRLATEGSVTEARSFLSQYEGHQGYGQMFAALVHVTASSDFQAALQMARSLQDSRDKDRVMSALAQQRVAVDPAESIRLLAMISDQDQRIAATAQLAQQWQRQDAVAAANWTRSLPRGIQRDTAIASLVSGWQDMTPSRKLLINSIGDLERRQQAQVAVLYQVARFDPDSARRLLLEFDLPHEYRQQIESILSQQNTPRVGLSSQ